MTRLEKVCRTVVILGVSAFGILWFLDPTYSADETAQELIKSVLFRLLGSVIFFALSLFFGYRLWNRPPLSCLAVLLPCLAVVVNNFPFLALANGSAWVERNDLLWLFAAESFLIGLFEELAFRGTLFLAILEKRRADRKQIFLTTLISSAVFGLVHLANLLEGAGIGPTLMQVGYSFLIGGMCAIVLLKSGNILFPILLHGIFDFGGGIVSKLGGGAIWNTPTIVITAVLAVAVTGWMLRVLFCIDPAETDRFYAKNATEPENGSDENT